MMNAVIKTRNLVFKTRNSLYDEFCRLKRASLAKVAAETGSRSGGSSTRTVACSILTLKKTQKSRRMCDLTAPRSQKESL